MTLIRPQKLKKGDGIRIIAPCNALSRDGAAGAAKALESLAFRVDFGRYAFSVTDGYAGSVSERAADFNEAVADDSVAMVLFSGGEIGNELLPYLDYEAIRRHPKIVCSYSDGTTILEAIHSRTGLVTFYGGSPRLFDPLTDYNRRGFLRRLASDDPTYEKASAWRVICAGRGEGVLAGGYLINYDTMIRSDYYTLPPEPALFLIEDHEMFCTPMMESKWYSDLIQKNVFDRAAGLIVGHYSSDPAKVDALCAVLRRLFAPLGFPVVYCDDFGHGANMSIFPFGVRAALDTEAGVFTLAENGTE